MYDAIHKEVSNSEDNLYDSGHITHLASVGL